MGLRRLTGLVLPLCAIGLAHATNGYFTDGVGAANKGLAGAGSADPEELMIIATNPAGLALIGERIEVGLELFSPDRSYSTSPSLAQGNGGAFTIGPNDLTSGNKLFTIPYVAFRWQPDELDSIAAAFYGRGGMNTVWRGGTASFDPTGRGNPPITFPGTYGDGTAGVDLMQAFLSLTAAHLSADRQFSFGGSLIFAAQRFEARGVGTFAPYTMTFAQSGGTVLPTNLSDNGHDMSYGGGAAVGLEWRPDPTFSAALAYTSKMYMSKFTKYADLFANRGSFDIPPSATLGLTFRPIAPVAVDFDVQRIWYSQVDSVGNPIANLFACPTAGAGGSDLESCLGGSHGAGFGWRDMTVYKLGLRWDLARDWTGRMGVSHGTQPIPSSQVTFNILAPGVIEDHVALGLTHRDGDRGEFNVALTYALNKSVQGPNTFDPTQTISFKMHQIDLDFAYAWKH
jgi:long-chain fatty acid transport protein